MNFYPSKPPNQNQSEDHAKIVTNDVSNKANL